MENKIFKTVELVTEFEQDIMIQPTPEWDGIHLEFKEVGDKYTFRTLYLNEAIANQLIKEIQDMLKYVKDI